ncbi:hypothetical protein QF027_003302 [Streptomyces canus]|nr:hypothetical protein [Streptomyces canus]MDQ0760667.1 hypothetical protein [Streptomyces canus]
MAEQKSSQQVAESGSPSTAQGLPQPLRAAVSVLGRVPGAGTVGRVAGGALDRVGAVSPRGRRLAVYAGAGVLGVAGVVEWPVAVTGAAVAWLTQPRPGEPEESGDESRPTPRVLASSHGRPSHSSYGSSPSPSLRTPSDKLPPHETASPSDRGGPAAPPRAVPDPGTEDQDQR